MSNFNYKSLSYEDREAIHDNLAATTIKHISAFPDLFKPLPFNPAANPSQKLEDVHLKPAPSTIKEIHDLADTANAPLAQAARETLKREAAYVNAARFMLNRGENITSVTTHMNIADVALFQEGWIETIEQDNWQERNGLGISRGVTTIEAFGMAASEVVQKMGHVFLSFPRTSTIRNVRIDPALVESNNRSWHREVNHWLGVPLPPVTRLGRGKMLHLAWEGKTPAVTYGDDHKPESMVLGNISKGTIGIVKHGPVQPVVIYEGGDEPVVEIGALTSVRNREDANRVQNWQRETLAGLIGISVEKITVE
ncbi:MAG TPA: hypothetical protein VLF39_04510 [Candidatus Saccharimonadales bacterium]|nr:hypothetical protein [Candidatus Saccharimonadales bacterium]